ncbi:MAG: hypothetical protein ACFFD7_05650 [Candidatus Thorarchaeota archaeon]
MGEYKEKEENKGSKHEEIFYPREEGRSKDRSEIDFEPLEEPTVIKVELGDTFQPKEEKVDNPLLFEANFIPRDEPNTNDTPRKKIDQQTKRNKLEVTKSNRKIKSHPLSQFINDLREKLIQLVPKNDLLYRKKLTDIKLSYFLGQNENHIYQIKKNINRNPKFQLELDLLREYKKSLTSKFKDKCNEVINIIENYENKNNLKESREYIYNFHPKIRLDYFKEINTKEKAYWLGFIYADGGLSYQTKNRNFIRFHFGLDIKDKDSRDMVYRLANTLGIEGKFVKPDSRGITLRIMITNNTLARHLNDQGVIIGKKKSKNIVLPNLGSRPLNLTFLLGYYDGDGTEGSTVISSGSKKFLEQIKKKYAIDYDLRYKKSESVINGKIVKGEGWDLALGANLFNEMMRNYEFSMSRKRKIFETPEEKSERMRQLCIDRAKLKINDDLLEDLKKLVWEVPLYKVAEKYKISISRISEICKKYKIDKPPIGYWKTKHQ